MIFEENIYGELEQRAFNFLDELNNTNKGIESIDDVDYYDDFDNLLTDIDFSEISGKSFKKNFAKVGRKLNTKIIAPENRQVIVEGGKTRPMPNQRDFGKRMAKKPNISSSKMMRARNVQQETQLSGGEKYNVKSNRPQKIAKIVVPDDKKVIIQGVSDFILDKKGTSDAVKNIGYYKGKKLKELVFTFNNNSALPFEFELFNPSMPLDYLYSTSLNLNDKIQVAGGEVSYTDVLFNVLANSTMIPNAKFVFAGANLNAQKVQPIVMINKSMDGEQKIYPFNLDLQIDTMQVQGDIVAFNFFDTINRPYIPDGMDILKYTVLPNMTVTMAFFYDQISLKKVFRKEARTDKGLL